ncbi:MAG: hypothetical protein IPP15_15915 [Saprospiraceae bacterium]|uniref:Uncharacterized protein n=1 Tax=Candidatus Opimibacter skivensis TaxID=2982028 RepID=A0A9D7XNW3_9BACT|nr:hypothetical protein [Candidatus Opimibacter skivensis]
MKAILFFVLQINFTTLFCQSFAFKIDTVVDDFTGNVTIGSQSLPFTDTSEILNGNALGIRFFKTWDSYVIGLVVFSEELWLTTSDKWIYLKLTTGEVLKRPVAFQSSPKYTEILHWGYGWGSSIACVIMKADYDVLSKTGIEKIRIEKGSGLEVIDFTVYSKSFQNNIMNMIDDFKNNVVNK